MNSDTEQPRVPAAPASGVDRRIHPKARSVFEQAWVLMRPILDGAAGQGDLSGYSLAIALRAEFPQLSAADIHLLVSTAMRLHRGRSGPIVSGG